MYVNCSVETNRPSSTVNPGLEGHCPAWIPQMTQFESQRTVHRWLLLQDDEDDDSVSVKVDTTRVLECEFGMWIVTEISSEANR
jgi:hypothetical protein